jgi:peptide/nickel transport system substrate-binding protein
MSTWRGIPISTGDGVADRGRGILLLLVCGLMVACGVEEDHQVLRMGLATPPRHLDPRFATDATSERVNRLLYRRLTEFDAQGLPVPSLANWERLSSTHYRFTLGVDGRTFSDGTRLSAADVAATYASVLDPVNASPHRVLLGIIEEIVVLDPDRVDFLLSKPDPLFPAYLGIGILPARLIRSGHGFADDPVGSGPFRFVAWTDPGRLRLQRRSDGQAIELLTVGDPNVRVMKLLRGEIHLLQNDLAPELVNYLRGRREVHLSTEDGVNFSYLGFNLEDADTRQREVRRALAHAIDRDAILRYLFQGSGRPARGIFPPEHWAGSERLSAPAYDPERARALLAAAGYADSHPLRLSFKTSSDPFRIRLATVIQAQLERVGIRVDVESYDWGTFFGDVKAGRFQLYALTWVGVRTPDIFRYVFHSASVPPNGANRGRYRNPEADRLIEAARAEPDLRRQAVLYRELQALLLRDLPYVPLWFEDQFYAARRQVRGYTLAPDGNYDGLIHVELPPESAEPVPRQAALR